MNGLTLSLINNATLLLSLSIIYEISYLIKIKNRVFSQVVNGILIGLIGIAIMSYPFELVPGVFYDARSVLLCVAALMFGFTPASVATVITIVYRCFLDGAGLVPGISMIIASTALGLLYRRFFNFEARKMRWLRLYLFGLVVHIVYLSFTFMLPWNTAMYVIRQITPPVLGINPVCVLLLSLLLLRQKEYKETALQAAEAESRYRAVVDNAPAAIFIITERKIQFANRAALQMLGATDMGQLIGLRGFSLLHPDYRYETVRQLESVTDKETKLLQAEHVYVKLDGSPVDALTTIVPFEINGNRADLIFAQDITEKKRMEQRAQEMEAQLRQQQKLEAIGTLAGGVAHEINNPLNGIMNYAQLILDASNGTQGPHATLGSGEGISTAEYSREIIHETERISTIVKNLLQFSRHEKQSHSYASIYDIIGQTVSLVNTIIKKDQINLDLQLDDGLPEIKCRSQQIQQVFMNLLTNARDAVNTRYPYFSDEKLIQVRCSEVNIDGRRWLRLTVRDSGCGIPEELRERIYEPFFSTKPKELGTGLGLSISYGIIKEHNGNISFDSEVGKYTRFVLDLPIDNGWTLNPESREE